MNKVLVIDDDEDLVAILSRRLTKAGYEVEAAYDSLQGTEFAIKLKPAAIVLDVNMPGGGGISTLRNLKLSVHTRRIPVVILTGTADIFLLDEIKNIGVDGLFKKPDGVVDLIKKVQELINSPADPAIEPPKSI